MRTNSTPCYPMFDRSFVNGNMKGESRSEALAILYESLLNNIKTKKPLKKRAQTISYCSSLLAEKYTCRLKQISDYA